MTAAFSMYIVVVRPPQKKTPTVLCRITEVLPPTESPPKRQKVDEEAARAQPQPTACEPVYPVQASILQRPAQEATASDLVQADDDDIASMLD